MARHCTFGVGGPADYFVEVSRVERIAEIVERAAGSGVPVVILGAGTNLLVSDQGIEGLVVRCNDRSWRVDGERLRAASGLKMIRLARIAADHGLSGLEFGIGIPGSVGGAVYQNAGCFESEVVDLLVEVGLFQPRLGWSQVEPRVLDLGYRSSALRSGRLGQAVVGWAEFQLRAAEAGEIRRKMAQMVAWRRRSQPLKAKSAGSIFKNPPSESAGRLIEACGLKGHSVGGAQVSLEHANFIVNHAGASAQDVWHLVTEVQAQVQLRSGLELEPEIQRVGRW